MTDLGRHACTLDDLATALAKTGYELPHGTLQQLSAPYHLIDGDATLPDLVMHTGTLLVAGSLAITGPVDCQQSGRPITNLIVTGNCTLSLAYIDAFLCVGGNLAVGTLIADSNWNGGVFVGGDLRGHTLVMKDIGVEVDGDQHVERIGDSDDPESAARNVPGLYTDDNEPDPRGFFIALRDTFGQATPASAAVKTKVAVAKATKPAKPAATKPAKPAATKKAKPAATKKAKPAAKKAKPAVKRKRKRK